MHKWSEYLPLLKYPQKDEHNRYGQSNKNAKMARFREDMKFDYSKNEERLQRMDGLIDEWGSNEPEK